jgi:carbamoyltransferase
MKRYNNVGYEHPVSLVWMGNIVAFFQGRSEAGPRALGNRSLLFNAGFGRGREYFNNIKGREEYRPLAGSILHEHASVWFHTEILPNGESPFMSYAVPVKELRYKEEIPTIIQPDGTCRIQTVKENQNLYFYEFLKTFFTVNGLPIVGNTSFNLAGEPIVETLDEAIDALNRSKIEFLYLPEEKELIYVENK